MNKNLSLIKNDLRGEEKRREAELNNMTELLSLGAYVFILFLFGRNFTTTTSTW